MVDFLQELTDKNEKVNLGLKVKPDNTAWIRCPFHGDGQERTPSCCVDLVKGKFPAGFWYCYGCGKHGNWNVLAEALGLSLLDSEEIKHNEMVIAKLTPAQKAAFLEEDINERINFSAMVDWNPKNIWRGINGQLLFDIGAKKFFNRNTNTNMIFLPAYQNKQLNGGIRGILERKGKETAYFNTAGSWVKKTLFPFDYTRKFMKDHGNILALVEGPRDALNMLQYGFPALAILGSKNWSSFKASLVTLLDPDLIILAFDNDEAGHSATDSVLESFKDYNNLIQLTFKEGQDPGALTEEEVRKFYKKLMKKLK